MTRFIDRIKASDVSFWGMAALSVGAIAVLSANMPSIIPADFATKMHATRLDGASLNHMRAQVNQLKNDAARMRDEYNRLTTMLKLAEQGRNDVTKRIGAMETSLPLLLEAIPPGVKIDNSITTASIGQGSNKTIIEGQGGYAIVSRSAIEETSYDGQRDTPQEIIKPLDEVISPQLPNKHAPDKQVLDEQSLKEIAVTDNNFFGIALGKEIKTTDAIVAWQDIERKVGTLLLGLKPILSKNDGSDTRMLIAGPIENYAQAEQLCSRMLRVGIACLPLPYEGVEMPK